MNGDGVIGRRHFLRTIGLGAAGLAATAAVPLSFTDWMALQAAEMRKNQMACILLWMAGGPSQLETFDPKPGTEHGGETKAIATAVPGISIAEGWDATAKVMKDIALIRSMTNKEGNHQRATYQLHTGYVPSATVKHPHIGCSVAGELGESHFDLPHIVSIGGPTIGAGFLGAAIEPFVVQNPEKPPENTQPKVATDRFRRRLGLLDHLENAGFERIGGLDRVQDHRALYHQTARMVLSPQHERVRPGRGARADPRGLRPRRRSARAACWPAGWSRPASPSSRSAPTAGTPTSRTTTASASSPGRSTRPSPP